MSIATNHELKKYALRQTRDGTIVSFVLHPSEHVDDITTAPIGTRFVVAMVRLADDSPSLGESLNHQQKEPPSGEPHEAPASDPNHSARGMLAQLAAMRCGLPQFQEFLRATFPDAWGLMNGGSDRDRAAEVVRWQCGVKSRAEIVEHSDAAEKWYALQDRYHRWAHGAVA